MAATTCEFGTLRIAYDERVLRPRRWTELQSSWAAEESLRLPPGPILELCAGAGHIGLLAAVLTGRRPLIQVDLDPNAAAFARQNAMAAGVTELDFRIASLETALGADERFPLMLADPPYIPSHQIDVFPDDPVSAIDGGHDGLALIDACLALAGAHLVDDGVLLLQVRGPSQAEEVSQRGGLNGLCVAETRVVDNDRAVTKLHRV